MKKNFLAENIQIKIEEKNLSVSEFERSAGLKRSAVSNILSGKSKNPTIEVVTSIANRLGCSISELLESGHPEKKATRTINVNPKNDEERLIFYTTGILLIKKLEEQDINPSFTKFMDCFKELFFYATHSHKDNYKDDNFLLWIIRSHFSDEKK